jgi:hypothetical protein
MKGSGMVYAGASRGLELRGAPVALLAVGPGLLDDHNMPQAFIFDAGRSCGSENPLLRFYAEEMVELDWLRDYLMDTRLATLLKSEDDFIIPAEEELEDTYQKDALTNIDADAGWADS